MNYYTNYRIFKDDTHLSTGVDKQVATYIATSSKFVHNVNCYTYSKPSEEVNDTYSISGKHTLSDHSSQSISNAIHARNILAQVIREFSVTNKSIRLMITDKTKANYESSYRSDASKKIKPLKFAVNLTMME